MALSDVSIRRPVFAWMLMLGLIGFGAVSFMRLGVSQLPDVDFPIVTIGLHMESAAPEVMEQDVVDIIEDKVMSIEGVKKVSSNSKNSYATVVVEFDLSRNIDVALQDVQAKVSQALKSLPPQLDPPSITKTNPDDMPIVSLALQAPGYKPQDVMVYVRDVLKNQITTVEGVGDVNLGGYTDPNMRVWVKEQELKKFGLAANDVVQTLLQEQVNPPTGQVDQGERQFNLRFFGEVSTPEEFSRLRLARTNSQAVDWNPPRLGEIARIEEGLADITTMSRSMGVPAVSIGIIKQRGSNAVEVAKNIRQRVEEIQKTLPQGMNLAINFDSTRYIREAVEDLNFTLLLSAALTGLVCWAFLGSWASTFNVLMAIPVSIVGSFTVFYFLGFTLNTFTLLALNLAIGIVVDDAIMVIENIVRHREMGKSRVKAALEGAREITFAALAASISVIAIFLPVAFMRGLIGKFFFQFGVAMTIAVLISLLEALTLTPMRAAYIRDKGTHQGRGWLGRRIERLLDWSMHAYRSTLSAALRFRWAVIAGTLALSVLSGFSYLKLRQEFLPPEDQSRFVIRIQTPIGSSLAVTDAKMAEVEKFLASRPEIDRYYVTVGSSGQNGDVNTGFCFVTMKDRGDRGVDPGVGHELTQQEFMQVARKNLKAIKGLRVVIQDLSMRGLTTSRGFPVEFTIQGPEWDQLGQFASQIMKELGETGLVTDIDTDYRVGMPELQMIPDRSKISKYTLNMASVGATLNAMIGGARVGQYAKGGHRYDVRMKMHDDGRGLQERVRGLSLRNMAGNLTNLASVVELKEKPTVQSIAHLNRQRSVTIYANVQPGVSQKLALEKAQDVAKRVLPNGYSVKLSGSAQTFSESIQSLLIALVMGLFVAYMILGTQFNSFIHPFTILMALPFCLVGAFIALWATNQSLNIYSMIGLILLMGIAKKNSILLVDFTNQTRRERGLSVRDALVEACPIRLRPILMTSIATVAGAIPAALAIGPGAESRIPMAITVIGGVIISTLFSLYLVPCVYSVMSPLERSDAAVEE